MLRRMGVVLALVGATALGAEDLAKFVGSGLAKIEAAAP